MSKTRFHYTRIKGGWKCTATVPMACGCELKISATSWDKSIALFECKAQVETTTPKHRC